MAASGISRHVHVDDTQYEFVRVLVFALGRFIMVVDCSQAF